MKVAWIVTIAFLAFLGATYFNTTKNHFVNLKNGKHTEVTIVWNFIVRSEKSNEYFECGNWTNPYAGLDGQLLLSSCLLHQKCEVEEDSALKKACST